MQNEKSNEHQTTAVPLQLASPITLDEAAPTPSASHNSVPHKFIKPHSARIKILLAVIIPLLITAFLARNLMLGIPVEAHLVVIGELRQTVVASGRVIWPQRVEVAAEITGRVSDIPVVEGQQVTQNQLLIQLEDKDERANVVLAMASLAQAEAKVKQQRELTLPMAQENVDQARVDATQMDKELTRMRQLNTQHFVSDAELETATLKRDVAASKLHSAILQLATNQIGGGDAVLTLATLAQARASLQLAQIKLEQDSIRAPADGTLISRSVEEGNIVQAGKILMVLAAQGETQLEVQIDEKNLAKLALGQMALGSADAFSEQRFAAEIIYINPGIDASRGSVEIKLRVNNPPVYLRQDMTVSVDIETATRSNALVIPTAALRDPSGNSPWVLVVRNHRTQHQVVKTGLRGDDNLEVLEGITAGEAVIFPSLGLIKSGQHVRVTSAKPL